jgi:hypothetical protein
VETITLAEIFNFIKDGGTLAVLIIILWSGHRGWWVFGKHYNEVVKELDEARDALLQDTLQSRKAVDLAIELATQLKAGTAK